MVRLPRPQFRLRTLFLVMFLVAIVLVLRQPVQIAYHDWAMCRAHAKSDSTRSVFHLNALVRLGRYEKRTFYLQNMVVESREARGLFKSLRELPFEDRVLTMGPYGGGAPDYITIYAPGDQMHRYIELIESTDIPSK